MTALRVAVVGAGEMGRHHIRVVRDAPETVLAYVVDPDPVAEAAVGDSRAQFVATVAELLEHHDPPDFAIVAAPTGAHCETALTLLKARIPVLVEKPIATTPEDAAALIAAAETAGVVFSVGHVERFNPAVRELAARLETETLGHVFQMHAQRLSPFPHRAKDSGVALDLATHDLDVMCALAGAFPTRLSAEIDRKAHRSHEDLLAAVMRFESGLIGVLEVNWLTPTKVRRLTVTGERGMFVVDYLRQDLTLYENAAIDPSWDVLAIFSGVSEGNATRFSFPRVEPLRAQLASFAAAVRGEAHVEVTPEQGLRVLELALALVASGSRGTPTAYTTAEQGDRRWRRDSDPSPRPTPPK